jgi:predicted dehydrogenase
MHRVAIIGTGQLGSRHLQGLARIDIPVEIIVLDPSTASLDVARSRFLEIPNRGSVGSVTYVDSLRQAPGKFDLAIVATTADIRGKVVKEVLDRGLTKKMVLEKVVFQSASEFDWARSLFAQHGILCWVNCPRRTLTIYRRIKELVLTEGKLLYWVFGGDWGLGCNAIHFVEVFLRCLVF